MPEAPTSPLLALAGMDADRKRIETAMRKAVVTTDAYLTEIASHLIVAGGKRLRPALSVVVGRLDGQPTSDDIIRGGVACELVHLGSLYHDDVMDEAETRRGVDTVNARWGNLQAILAGDFLLARASEIAASLGTEVAGLLARTISWLCEGQIEELRHTYDITRSEDSYLASIHGKTASLFGTAARIGGIVAGARPFHDRRRDGVRQRLRHGVPDRRRRARPDRHGRAARQAVRARSRRGRLHVARDAHVVERAQQWRRITRHPRQATRADRARQGARHRAVGRRHRDHDWRRARSSPHALARRSTGSRTTRSSNALRAAPIGALADRRRRSVDGFTRPGSRS